MKKLIPCLLLLGAWTAHAQGFEGTIRWSMKMEITDPETKAKMEEGMKKMNDPANQAKMKEMQAKMNDPQMKAMMDANPQMKAQMENAMKMMAGGDMSSMMPKGYVMMVKGNNLISKMEGGPMQMEMLYLKDKDATYSLDRANKTYSVMKASGEQDSTATQPKVTKTSEKATILGYSCTKYLVEVVEGTRTINESIWTTTDIKDIDLKSLSRQRMGKGGHSIIYEGMEGAPLKVEASMKEGKMTMEVTEIKRGSLNAADFAIPAGFTETQGMFGGKY